jgi:two-component system response regulator YesN
MSAPYRAVIFDDEPWSREVVKSLGRWDELGLEVVGEADDGNAGLRSIAELGPDIVITDMRMPGMDGTELLRRIATEHPNVRIVVMSGYDDFAYLRQALQSRAEDYLLKPIDPDELNRTLRACVERIAAPPDRRPISMRTPVAFGDPDLLDEYVAHRQRVFAYLLELDTTGVRRTLDDLECVLQAKSGGEIDPDIGERVIHDFVILLEEFMARNGAPVDPDLFRSRDLYSAAGTAPFKAIARLYQRAMIQFEETRRDQDQLNLDDVKSHIDHYFGDPLSLQSVARLFLVSREHLSRVFKKRFGVTVNDYITDQRMTRARELLHDGDLEIKQIAGMVGYNDLAYFYRVFKKKFGYPPGQER